MLFLGVAAAVVAMMLPELHQLYLALTHQWHFGTPPSWLGTFAAFVVIGASVGLLVLLAQRRRLAPGWLSVLMLAAFALSIWEHRRPFFRRSVPGANLVVLQMGTGLHQKMRARLEAGGTVPTTLAPWEEALSALEGEDPNLASPFRARDFSTVPWKLRFVQREGDFLLDATPGTFTVFVPAEATRFTLAMIGVDFEHQIAKLRDDQGNPLELKGALTPDTRH